MTESELYHHGIRGQKWGVRRFQNEDGTLTSAGKKHVAERKSGNFNSNGGTDLTQLGGSSGGGGGGGAPLDEEDQKKLEEFWEDMAKLDGYEFPGQDESEFLAELGEAGIDTEKMTKEQIDALYKKAADTYNNARNGRVKQSPQENSTDILNPIHKGREKAKEASKDVEKGEENKKELDRDFSKKRTVDDFVSTPTRSSTQMSRSLGTGHVAINPGNEEQERKRKEVEAAEQGDRKEKKRPTSRKKYVTEATGTLKRRGSSGTGKVGHSYQAPSESELYHEFGPLFYNDEETFITESELYHHGIKGQKWGVRRFQNEDGTLTEAGKRRDARQIQKDLNTLDNEWARAELKRQRAQREITRIGKRFDKDVDRAERKGDIKEAKKKLSEAHDKAMKPANKYNDAMRSIESIEAQQWKKIGEATMKNYDIGTKPVSRYGSEGAKAARLFGALGVLSYGAATGDVGKVTGTKFKVKAK